MINNCTVEKYISNQTGAIEEMAESICEYAVRTIADMIVLAKNDMDTYIQLRDMKEIRIPFISMGRFLAITRKCGIFEDGMEHLGRIHFIHARGSKEYGIRVSECFYDKELEEMTTCGFGMYISPHLGKHSFELTKEEIIHQFLDKELGQEKADIEARYIYNRCTIQFKGARFVPNYDSEGKLMSVKS